jgi:hypothetical protein
MDQKLVKLQKVATRLAKDLQYMGEEGQGGEVIVWMDDWKNALDLINLLLEDSEVEDEPHCKMCEGDTGE